MNRIPCNLESRYRWKREKDVQRAKESAAEEPRQSTTKTMTYQIRTPDSSLNVASNPPLASSAGSVLGDDRGRNEVEVEPAKEMRAVRQFILSKQEVERIQSTPFRMLSRREVAVQKLLRKFHDDSQRLQREQEKKDKHDNKSAGSGNSYDADAAQRIRVLDESLRTIEEQVSVIGNAQIVVLTK